MSNAVIGNLRVNLSANSAEFSSGMKRAQGSLEGFKKFLLPLAASLSAGAVARGFDNAITKLDEIGKTADRLGLTTDALQELRSAAEQSGVGVSTLDMAMQRFGRRLAEARQGAGEAKDALKEMGITLTEADGSAKSTEAVLNEVADAMRGMGDQTDRNRIAMRLFDSEGVALVNMLRDGADGLDRMRERAREMGAVIGDDSVRAAEALRTEIDLLSTAVGNFAMTVASFPIRAFTDLFNLETKENLAEAVQDLRSVQEALADIGAGAATTPQIRERLEAEEARLSARVRELNDRLQSESSRASPFTPSATVGGSARKGKTDAQREAEERDAAYERGLERLREMQAALHVEIDSLDMSTEARRDYRRQIDALNVATEAGVDLSAEQQDALLAEADAVAKLGRELSEAERAQRSMEDATRAVTDSIADGIRQASSFGDVLATLGARLAEVALMSDPVQDALTGALTGVLTSAGASFGAAAVPAFAKGTSFAPGGLAVVGEGGPELVDLPRGSRVYPNGRGPASGVSMSVAIDARGAQAGVGAQIEAALGRFARRDLPGALAAAQGRRGV